MQAGTIGTQAGHAHVHVPITGPTQYVPARNCNRSHSVVAASARSSVLPSCGGISCFPTALCIILFALFLAFISYRRSTSLLTRRSDSDVVVVAVFVVAPPPAPPSIAAAAAAVVVLRSGSDRRVPVEYAAITCKELEKSEKKRLCDNRTALRFVVRASTPWQRRGRMKGGRGKKNTAYDSEPRAAARAKAMRGVFHTSSSSSNS